MHPDDSIGAETPPFSLPVPPKPRRRQGWGRWAPRPWWPVLAARSVDGRPDDAPRSRRRADTGSPSRGARPSHPPSAGATSRAAPAPAPVLSSRHPRRCSSRRRTMTSVASSTSRPPTPRGGWFSGAHQWPVLGAHRAGRARTYDYPAIEPTSGFYRIDSSASTAFTDSAC